VTTQAGSQLGLAFSVDLPQRGKLYVKTGKISLNFVTGEVRFTTPRISTDILIHYARRFREGCPNCPLLRKR